MVDKLEVPESTSIDEDVDWISREIVWVPFFLIDFKISRIPFFKKTREGEVSENYGTNS